MGRSVSLFVLSLLISFQAHAQKSSDSTIFSNRADFYASISIIGDKSDTTGSIHRIEVDSRLNVAINASEDINVIKIVGSDGKVVIEQVPLGGPTKIFSMNIPLSKLPPDTYVIEAVAEDGFIARKFNRK